MNAKILLIDDSEQENTIVASILEAEGYTPIVANSAKQGLRLAFEHKPDLILLDVIMPDMVGWEVCRRLRTVSTVPVIFLSGQTDVTDVVKGLEVGGDDYVTKPFHKSELLARVQAQLRRMRTRGSEDEERGLATENFQINYDQREVVVRGEPVQLSAREFDLLALLVRNAERVVPTSELLREVWQEDSDGTRASLKVYISAVRRKIEANPSQPLMLVTVRGIGYRFQVPE